MHWAQVISNRANSGQTVREYCENEGIPVSSYYYWLKRLREAASGELAIIRSSNASKTETPMFAEIKLPKREGLSQTTCAQDGQLSIEFAGIRLTADTKYPVSKLTELLKSLVQPCC